MKKAEERNAELRRLVAESGMSYTTQALINAKIDKMCEFEAEVRRGNRIVMIVQLICLIILIIVWAL